MIRFLECAIDGFQTLANKGTALTQKMGKARGALSVFDQEITKFFANLVHDKIDARERAALKALGLGRLQRHT